MAYHAILEGSNLSVYRQSDCASDSKIGTLYNGEVFTLIGEHNGYFGNYLFNISSNSFKFSFS